MRIPLALLLVVLVTACGGGNSKSEGRKTLLVYQDPATFTDGTPIPQGAVVRTLFCGDAPGEYPRQQVIERVTPLEEAMRLLELPYDETVYCVGTATVAGVAGRPSAPVSFRCSRRGVNTICFAR